MGCSSKIGVPLAIFALAVSPVAESAYELAFSKRMGVKVYAEGEPQWCNQSLQLTIEAENARFFESRNLGVLVGAIGNKVLPVECQSATEARLEGRHQGSIIWQGSARKSNDWLVSSDEAQKSSQHEPAAAVVREEEQTKDTTIKESDSDKSDVIAESSVSAPPADVNARDSNDEHPTPLEPEEKADFSVNGWTPAPVLRNVEQTLDIVTTEDKKCAVHFTVNPKNKGLVYLQTEIGCIDGWVDGNGRALIKRIDGKQIARLDGNFVRGFFFGNEMFDAEKIVGVSPGKTKSMLALLKIDREAQAYYLGNITAAGGNQWGFCKFGQVRIITEDENVFLEEELIDAVVEQAAALITEYCPRQNRLRFSAGRSPWDFDKTDHNDNYYVTQVYQDRRSKVWTFNKSRAWNGVIAARVAKIEREKLEQERKEREERIARQQAERQAEYEKQQAERQAQLAKQEAERQAKIEEYRELQARQRAEQEARAKAYREQQAIVGRWQRAKSDHDRLVNVNGVALLAYQAGVHGTSFPLDLYAEQVVNRKPVSGAVLVRVIDDENDYADVDWPVSMRLEDKNNVITDEGIYFVLGRVTGGERRDGTLPLVNMEIDRAWLCKERLCGDHGDALALVRSRYDYPDFDPDQPPEQPKWQ